MKRAQLADLGGIILLIGLLRKEWTMSKAKLYQSLMVVVGLWVVSIGLAVYYSEVEITFVFLSLIIGAHFVAMPFYLITNLVTESKSHLWLHNPNSMFVLLGSKLMMAFLFTCATVIITTGLFLLNFQLFGN